MSWPLDPSIESGFLEATNLVRFPASTVTVTTDWANTGLVGCAHLRRTVKHQIMQMLVTYKGGQGLGNQIGRHQQECPLISWSFNAGED